MQKFKKWRNSSWSISPYNIFCLITVSFHILLFVKKLPPFLVCFCSPKYVQYSPPWNHLWGTERVPRLPKSYISTVIKHPVCLGRKCVWEMGARSLALTVPNGLVESSVLHPPWHTNEAPYGSLWLGSSQQEAAWQTGGGKEWRQEGIGRTISAWSCVRPQRSQQRSRLKPKSSLWLSESVGVCVFENACLHAIAHVCMCILLGRLTCISLFSRLLTEGISQSGCLGNRSHIHNVLFTNNQQSPVLTLVFWHCLGFSLLLPIKWCAERDKKAFKMLMWDIKSVFSSPVCLLAKLSLSHIINSTEAELIGASWDQAVDRHCCGLWFNIGQQDGPGSIYKTENQLLHLFSYMRIHTNTHLSYCYCSIQEGVLHSKEFHQYQKGFSI